MLLPSSSVCSSPSLSLNLSHDPYGVLPHGQAQEERGRRRRVVGKVQLWRIDERAGALVQAAEQLPAGAGAGEVAVLCGAAVGNTAFFTQGKLCHFSTHSSLEKTIERYKTVLEAERSVRNHVHEVEGQHVGFADPTADHEIPEVDQWSLGDENIEQLNVNKLTKLEEKLESTLRQIRSRKMALMKDLVTTLHEQERTLALENEQLRLQVAGSDTDQEGKEGDEPHAGEGNSGVGTGGDEAAYSPPPPRTLELFVDT